MDEADDPIVLRVPVCIGAPRAPNHNLFAMQYPLRPRWRPYDLDQIASARARPKQKQIELKLDTPSTATATGSASHPHTHTLASHLTQNSTSYAVGLLRVGRPTPQEAYTASLHLIPLDYCTQMRPTFESADDEVGVMDSDGLPAGLPVAGNSQNSAREVAAAAPTIDPVSDRGEASSGAAETGPSSSRGLSSRVAKPIAPVFQRAETEREEAARRSSHAFWLEQKRSEPWCDATFLPDLSERATAHREQIFRTES